MSLACNLIYIFLLDLQNVIIAERLLAPEDVDEDLLKEIMNHIHGRMLKINGTNMTQFPIQHLRPYAQITNINLSYNQIEFLCEEFPLQFPNLRKLILRDNELQELPLNIGCLTKLTHLDLYNNQLVHLPLDMHRLNNLVWVDLKHNPLEEHLALVCGDCGNDIECRACAVRIVNFYKFVTEKVGRLIVPPRRETNAICVDLDDSATEQIVVDSQQGEIDTNEEMEMRDSSMSNLVDRSAHGDVDMDDTDDEEDEEANLNVLLKPGVSMLEYVAYHTCPTAYRTTGSYPSMLDHVAYNTRTQSNTAKECLRCLCSALLSLLALLAVLAMVVDYRVIRESVDYHGSAILSENSLNALAQIQMYLQAHVIAVTRKFNNSFPIIRYVEPEPGYLELISNYIASMFNPVIHCFI